MHAIQIISEKMILRSQVCCHFFCKQQSNGQTRNDVSLGNFIATHNEHSSYVHINYKQQLDSIIAVRQQHI